MFRILQEQSEQAVLTDQNFSFNPTYPNMGLMKLFYTASSSIHGQLSEY